MNHADREWQLDEELHNITYQWQNSLRTFAAYVCMYTRMF
jgi:hypothetical protein